MGVGSEVVRVGQDVLNDLLDQVAVRGAEQSVAMAELTRSDRRMAVARLDELSAEISVIASWLDTLGDRTQDADRASVLLECCSRDLAASCWLLRPADHPGHPAGWMTAA